MKISASGFLLLASICFCLSICDGQLLEGIYCGRENCYDVLNITREATSSEVRRSYRRLAKTTHPDMFRDEVQKYEAEQRFKALGMWLYTFFLFISIDDAIKIVPRINFWWIFSLCHCQQLHMKFYVTQKPEKTMITCWTIRPSTIRITIDTIGVGWRQRLMCVWCCS